MPIVRSPDTNVLRFQRRYADYLEAIEHPPAIINKNAPRLLPQSQLITLALDAASSEDYIVANEVLDKVWAADARCWPRRLAQFLKVLSPNAQKAFSALVSSGCQPDVLAVQFNEATRAKSYAKDSQRLRSEIDELAKLADDALTKLQALVHRRTQFDAYITKEGFAVMIAGESSRADELRLLLLDLQELVARNSTDDRRFRTQLDPRRELLAGHAEWRLGRRIHEATGAYHDRRVEAVLDELREVRGLRPREAGTFKKRRQRYVKRFDAPRHPQKNEG